MAAAEEQGAGPGAWDADFISAFEDAAIGMALVALDSQPLRVNRALCRMLGYAHDEMIGTALLHVTHPDDLAEDWAQRDLLLAGQKESYQREKRYLHREGGVLWGHLTCTLVRGRSGEPLHFISQVQDITERKAAEEAHRRSEERFRSLTALSSDWFWEQDEEFRFTMFSDSRNASGWKLGKARAIGRRRWELEGYHPINMTWAEHQAGLEAHAPFHDFQIMRVLGDEPPSYLSCNGEPVFDAAGAFRGYRGTARDITASKLAEQRLRDTQALLHMAAQAGRLGAWAYDIGAARVTWSQEVCTIHEVPHGFSPTFREALGFFLPAHRPLMRRALKACLGNGDPFDVEVQIATAKRRHIWARVIGQAERDTHGRVRRIQGACQDISESRRAAEETRLMAEQLTTTLESLTDGFYTLDGSWRFTYVNAACEQLMRMKRADLLGRRLLDVFPELAETQTDAHFERAARENVTVQFEHYYVPFGIWVQVKIFPSKQGLAVDLKDVTERVAAGREIMRLNAELEERVKRRTAQLETANKELEAFSYSIAHDLRAPLSSIDGFSQKLAEISGDSLGERARHYLNRIRAGVRQMAQLTDGLLALASLSRAPLRVEPVDLAVLARSAVASCRARAPARVAEIEIAASLPAHGDAHLLSQVIGNLVDNAWKFTALRATARIGIGSEPGPGGTPVYYVRDNGAGFDMAYASKMFEAFQRMHAPAEFEGTGIGLAIAHKVIGRHGGRIWAEAAPDRGASFFFTLGTHAD